MLLPLQVVLLLLLVLLSLWLWLLRMLSECRPQYLVEPADLQLQPVSVLRLWG